MALINQEEAINKIINDKIPITNSILAIGASREVYEAVNKTCDRHAKMLQEMQPEIIHCEECRYCQHDTVFDQHWCGNHGNGLVAPDFYCKAGRRTNDKDRR